MFIFFKITPTQKQAWNGFAKMFFPFFHYLHLISSLNIDLKAMQYCWMVSWWESWVNSSDFISFSSALSNKWLLHSLLLSRNDKVWLHLTRKVEMHVQIVFLDWIWLIFWKYTEWDFTIHYKDQKFLIIKIFSYLQFEFFMRIVNKLLLSKNDFFTNTFLILK